MKLFESAKFSRMASILFSPTETFWFCQIFKVGTSSKLAVGSSWHSHWQLPPPAWLPPIAATLLAFCRDSVLLRTVFLFTLYSISALQCAAFLCYCAQYFARSAPLCITWVRINYGLLCPCAQCDRGSCWSWLMWICWALFTINSRCFCVCVLASRCVLAIAF